MAARRAWVVLVDDHRRLYQMDHDYVGGMFIPLDHDKEVLTVYFRENQAIEAAHHLAQKYPGKDVHVLKQTFGFSSQATTPVHKQWTDEGHFIPVK